MAAKKKKQQGFGPAIFILGGTAVLLVAWYAYQVYVHFTETDEPRARAEREAPPEPGAALKIQAEKESFRAEDVVKCEVIGAEYLTQNGEPLKKADVPRLLNLPDDAEPEAVRQRCIDFSKAAAKMERLSHHTHHIMVCGGSHFEAEDNSKYTIRPDPKGRGVTQTVTAALPKNLLIGRGRSVIIDEWQVHNMGDGCVIIGVTPARAAQGLGGRKGKFFNEALKVFRTGN